MGLPGRVRAWFMPSTARERRRRAVARACLAPQRPVGRTGSRESDTFLLSRGHLLDRTLGRLWGDPLTRRARQTVRSAAGTEALNFMSAPTLTPAARSEASVSGGVKPHECRIAVPANAPTNMHRIDTTLRP